MKRTSETVKGGLHIQTAGNLLLLSFLGRQGIDWSQAVNGHSLWKATGHLTTRKQLRLSFLLCFACCLPWQPEQSVAQESSWQRHFTEGNQLRNERRYAEAERAYSLALAEAEKFGPEDRRLALSLNELAVVHHSRGQLNEAEPLYRRAL